MARTCPKAGCGYRELDDKVILCVKCATSFSQSSESAPLSVGQETDLYIRLRRQALKDFWVLAGAVSLITGLSFWGVGKWVAWRAETYMKAQVAEQFRDERVRTTLQEVANSKAAELLNNQVRPEVVKLRTELNDQVRQFDTFLTSLRTSYSSQYASLSNEIAVLRERSRLTELADQAVAEGKLSAFEELRAYAEEPKVEARLQLAAKAECDRVVTFYLTYSRDLGESLFVMPGQTPKPYRELHTALLEAASSHPDWSMRLAVVQQMGERRQLGVPEMLLKRIASDDNLAVKVDAMKAFSKVTGHHFHPLDFSAPKEWWQAHCGEVTNQLSQMPVFTVPDGMTVTFVTNNGVVVGILSTTNAPTKPR